MSYTESEVLQFIEENDVKFIRLVFCDIFGTIKNISIMPDELHRAFEHGVAFDASAVKGFMNADKSDLFLFPDPATLAVLPWRPQHGRVVRFFCNIRYPDGTPFEGDTRHILRDAEEKLRGAGYTCKIGAECEFYLFETDERGVPTKIPHDRAGYCDIAPADKGENVRREICLTLEEMGIRPESSHHEQGPGQHEIDFKYSDALEAGDNVVTFKTVVKAVAARSGLFASFMPKPLPDRSGSGMHINFSLHKNGENIFRSARAENGEAGCLSAEAQTCINSVLGRIAEMTVVLNPLANSYGSFGLFAAPKYIGWSRSNRSQLVRIPAAKGEYERMELRSPDPSCNPYLAFALLIYAVLDGLQNGGTVPVYDENDINLYTAKLEKLKGLKTLPETLAKAVSRARRSTFIHEVLPEKTVDSFLETKQGEWAALQQSDDASLTETAMYFETV